MLLFAHATGTERVEVSGAYLVFTSVWNDLGLHGKFQKEVRLERPQEGNPDLQGEIQKGPSSHSPRMERQQWETRSGPGTGLLQPHSSR